MSAQDTQRIMQKLITVSDEDIRRLSDVVSLYGDADDDAAAGDFHL